MDSLLANYASSDDEDNSPEPPSNSAAKAPKQQQKDDVFSSSKRAGLFNSLPPPKSSLFNSIPAPKSQSYPQNHPNPNSSPGAEEENPKPKPPSTSLFSALPPPSSKGKKVVQFRPPTVTTPQIGSVDDDEDEDELDRKRKRSKESISTSSASSFLASVPAPRHSATLGALGSGRRSMLETEASNDTAIATSKLEYVNDQSNEGASTGYNGGLGVTSGPAASSYNLTDQHSENYDYSSGLGGDGYGYYNSYGSAVGNEAGVTYEAANYSHVNENVDYVNYNSGCGDYGNNVAYENTWTQTTIVPEAAEVVESALHVPGKKGRRDGPPQIIEVKQDELIKNRPREDQVKMTGIAFGPAYQPASSKGKPSKLHKRKHQIGSLFFDMKQKEMELAERRSKGFLTKSQTQAKYGW